MKILAVDIGTGTQDILLVDTRLDIENSIKLIMPSPTMQIRKRLLSAAESGQPVLLAGVMMGGGPIMWGAQHLIRAGIPVYATPDAAKTFNDDLDFVHNMGVTIVSQDEAQALSTSVLRIDLSDFNYLPIQRALAEFGVELSDLSLIAVAVFDHGEAPPEISDRQFRFDYLRQRIQEKNHLSAFAYPADQIPNSMTRMKSVAITAGHLPCQLVVMDTAPAAVLGATLDPVVAEREKCIIANIGNMHTLAFRINSSKIEGVVEHHTGKLDQQQLAYLLCSLADNSLTNELVFNNHGHGALVISDTPLELNHPEWNVAITGPRRNLMRGSSLRPYFAVPYGDMMLAGCYGLLAAAADLLPNFGEEIKNSLNNFQRRKQSPWEI